MGLKKLDLLFEKDDGKILVFNTGKIKYNRDGEPIEIRTFNPKEGVIASLFQYYGQRTIEGLSREELLKVVRDFPELDWEKLDNEEGHFACGIRWWGGCTSLQRYITARAELLKRGENVSTYDERMKALVKKSPFFSEIFEDLLKINPELVKYGDI